MSQHPLPEPAAFDGAVLIAVQHRELRTLETITAYVERVLCGTRETAKQTENALRRLKRSGHLQFDHAAREWRVAEKGKSHVRREAEPD